MSNIYSQLSENDLQPGSKKSVSPAPKSSAGGMGVKVGITLSFILSLTALAGSGLLYQNLNSESRQRRALEASQVQFEEKAASFETLAAQYKTEIGRMSEQLKKYADERQAVQDKLEKSSEEIAALQARIQELEPPAVPAVQNFITDSPAGASEPGIETGEAADAADAAPEESVEVDAAEPPALASSAKVMTVNRKFNFVVVNLGLKDNLKMGDVLVLEREGQAIGKAKVEKLYDTFAAATILEESQSAPIQEGDIIRRPV